MLCYSIRTHCVERFQAPTDIIESATFSFRIRLPSTRIFLLVNPAYESAIFIIPSPEWKFWNEYESGIMWMLNPDIFLSSDVTIRIEPRVSAKFQFRYESLKSKFGFSFVYNLSRK